MNYNRWYVVTDVQDNVLRFFAIDHVLVSFVTIAPTGAIFSLQFIKNRLAAGLRWRSLSAPQTPSRKNRGPTYKGRGRGKGKGIGWEGRGQKGRGGGRAGRGKEERRGRGGEGKGKDEGKGEGGGGPPNANSWIHHL